MIGECWLRIGSIGKRCWKRPKPWKVEVLVKVIDVLAFSFKVFIPEVAILLQKNTSQHTFSAGEPFNRRKKNHFCDYSCNGDKQEQMFTKAYLEWLRSNQCLPQDKSQHFTSCQILLGFLTLHFWRTHVSVKSEVFFWS